MTVPSLWSGFASDATQVDVERAIAEIRAGRPVLLRDEAERVVALAAEAVDAALCAILDRLRPPSTRLALTAPRLRRLGLARREAGAIALPVLDMARLHALVADPEARIDAPAAASTPLEDGALELMRLAQVLPAAIVADGGAEAAFPGLLGVGLPDVLAYRAVRVAALRIVSRAQVPLEGAPDSEFVVFRGGEGLRDQAAIIVGRPDFLRPVLVRLHSACLTGDLFGSLKCDCGDQLRYAARFMAENGGGVLLYLDQEGRGNGLASKVRAYDLQARGFDTYDADAALGFDSDRRIFDFAAEMLKKLGARRVRVMTNNPEKIAALAAAGLEIADEQRVLGRLTDHNARYLEAKRDKAGHFIDLDSVARLTLRKID
ncbi:GTP+cyclohydrolase-2 [Methylocapsa aurea]|uniref:GTP cyclohydrolase II RibA n=1 Tax=Methylocapsa aurea TaxID=663610 RepID=UPI003D18F5BD